MLECLRRFNAIRHAELEEKPEVSGNPCPRGGAERQKTNLEHESQR